MILATGDCHGGFQRFSRKHFPQQRKMGRDDYIIILGDFGGVWDSSAEERKQLDWLNEKPFTTLFVPETTRTIGCSGSFPWRTGMAARCSVSGPTSCT